jgi:anti-sigma regulatory factor (Ser/Thr protein kinase)
MDFDVSSLAYVRHLTGRLGLAAGLAQSRVDALLLAVSEVTTNSVRHAGGGGQLACWLEHDRFVCEVRDKGRISDPLAGRVRPHVARHDGRGLWLMHQLCDLVQVRVLDDRQVIRLHLSA